MLKRTLIYLFICVFCLIACTKKPPVLVNDAITVVTTLFPAYDFVRTIAGDKVELILLVSAGSQPHSFEPSPQDIKRFERSDIFIYNGGVSEAWVDALLKTLPSEKRRLIKMFDAVDLLPEEHVEGMQEDRKTHSDKESEITVFDEHVWTSPKNAIKIVQAIAQVLSLEDEQNAAFYLKNAEDYIEKLNKLDQDFRTLFATAQRNLIIVADRFPLRYFASEYGLQYYAAFSGCSTQSEPSVSTVTFLINKVRQEQVPVVFYLELSEGKIAQTVSLETGAKKEKLNAVHTLSPTDFEKGVSYLDLMNYNARVLQEALN